MPEEIKPEVKPEPPKKDNQGFMEDPENFKIAELWIQDGRVAIKACDGFWEDKWRAVGILDNCVEIVKYANPKDPKIVKPSNGKIIDNIRNMGKKFINKGHN